MNEKEGGSMSKPVFVKWFSELSHKDVEIAGGKGASLAEMYNNKFPIPPGFSITAQAYAYFLDKTNIKGAIHTVLDGLDVEDTDALTDASKKIRNIIETAELPKEMADDIKESYEILDVDKQKMVRSGGRGGALEILRTSHEPPFVAVRSSATAEDLEDASFAGQQESFLNVKGQHDLLDKVKKCFSSLFTPRAIYYRTKKKFDHEKANLSVVVQKMVDSDKSGVMFSKNPVKSDETVMIEAVWGLGEGIVSGKIKPDSYVVPRDTDNFRLIKCNVYEKKIAITRDSSGKNQVVRLTPQRSKQQVLTNYEIKRLSQYAMQLEEHYGLPQDIEFAIEGQDIYIVQSRPITTVAKDESGPEITGTQLLDGLGASPGVGSGTVKIIHDLSELNKVKKGDVLVTEMTNPDMVVSMQRAAAIVTDEGGITSHAAIVSREMGIPAVVGTGNATTKLHDGQVITVDGSNGKVFEGKGENKSIEINPIVPTKTNIKVIVDIPDYAPRAAKSLSKGVGLVRLEGIIAACGKHPAKFVKDKNMKGYVEVLSKGLNKIAQHFEEVWIRSSDLRSDEYMNLDGAPKDTEGNPMLGDHGVRFSLRHPEILNAELTAVKEVADEFPHKKIGLMMPQIISVSELKEVKRIAREEVNIPKNVKIGIMVETPAAVLTIDKFCEEGLDFISFGTNDLTQYTLAIDRNNGDVQYLYDELHPAVLRSLATVISTCKKHGVETSICGQAASKPEMAKFLVKAGINSLSVNADAAQKISMTVAEVEKELENAKIEEKKEEVVEVPSQPEETVEQSPPVEEKKEEVVEVSKEEVSSEEKMPVPVVEEDIEEAVLRELEDEYNPGDGNGKNIKEGPSLNDAIPVESSDLESLNTPSEVDVSDVEGSQDNNPPSMPNEPVPAQPEPQEPTNETTVLKDENSELDEADEEFLSEENEDKTLNIF